MYHNALFKRNADKAAAFVKLLQVRIGYAWMKQNGMSIATESAMAKYYTSRAAFEVVDDAMQIMGGIGYTNDVRIARLWRDCRLSRIMAGTDEIMVHIAGRALLKEFANK